MVERSSVRPWFVTLERARPSTQAHARYFVPSHGLDNIEGYTMFNGLLMLPCEESMPALRLDLSAER